MTRTLATACAILATSWFALGCSSQSSDTPSNASNANAEIGQIGLKLSAVSSSGVEYRLRNGEFGIWGWNEDCYLEESGDCENYEQTISSEDYLDQDSIELDLLRGAYDVFLNSGWQLERVVDGVGEVVEAQLLNSSYQTAWVQPYQTSWVTFQFGVGDEELWFSGQLSINMEVYEDPEDYYGGDCFYYGDGEQCWQECCTEYCDPSGCWGTCGVNEVPCDEIPDQGTGGAGPVPVPATGGGAPIPVSGTGGAPAR